MKPHTATLLDRICFNLPSLWAMVKRLIFRRRPPLMVRSAEETLRYMSEHACSVARYGDGEFRIMRGGAIGFQAPTASLCKRLKQIARAPQKECLVCIPNVFGALSTFTPSAQSFYRRVLRLQRAWIEQAFGGEYLYGDALISRFYLDQADKTQPAARVEQWKQLWDGKALLIVEGKYSRLGKGSDLFANAASVKRILCPPMDAWEAYEDILAATKAHAEGRLVLISLGPTATVLAYDLATAGIRAIDCGHFEIEYQWMLMGAEEKVPVPEHWINELGGLAETEQRLLEQDHEVILEISASGAFTH